MSYILILGAKSDIGKAVAHSFAEKGFNLYLAGRNKGEISKEAGDIRLRHNVECEALEFDALNVESHNRFYSALKEKPEGVIVVFGYLGNHDKAKQDFQETRRIIDSNFTGAVSILNIVAEDFEKRKSGVIAGISSVAGDRGRQSNYFYGAAKAALTAYLSGLRQRLSKSNVHVLTIKPGFVATRMTEGMALPPALTATPRHVARDILKAYIKRKNVIYTSSVWRLIMLIIRHIPEAIFKKTQI